MNTLWTFGLLAMTFMLLFMAFSLASARIYKRASGVIDNLVAEQRAITLLAFCFSPLIVSLLSTVLLFSPASELLIDIHCHIGDCDNLHTPFVSNSRWTFTLLPIALLLSTPALYTLAKLCYQQRQQSLIWKNLSSPASGYFIIDHNMPVAFTLGLFRPNIYLSKGLLSSVSKSDLAIVLEHETGHIRRYDNIIKFAASFSTILFPGKQRTHLLKAVQLAQEMCCDNYAARRKYDRLEVAQTLIHVNQFARNHQNMALCSINGSQIELRVKALLEPPTTHLSKASIAFALLALALAPTLITEPLHHLVETLL